MATAKQLAALKKARMAKARKAMIRRGEGATRTIGARGPGVKRARTFKPRAKPKRKAKPKAKPKKPKMSKGLKQKIERAMVKKVREVLKTVDMGIRTQRKGKRCYLKATGRRARRDLLNDDR